MRRVLPALVLMLVLAGCANDAAPDAPKAADDGPPTPAEAAALFAGAASALPDRLGARLEARNATTLLLSADAAFDAAEGTTSLHLRLDPALARSLADEEDGMPEVAEIRLYATREGSAILVGEEDVLLAPPGDALGQLPGADDDDDDLGAITDPRAFLDGLREAGVEVTSVTPDTLRGSAALRLDATVRDEDAGIPVPITIWLLESPARVLRVVATPPSIPQDEPDPFAGATLTLDLLYDAEVDLDPPADLARAMGLRHTGSAPFAGEGDITWTFAADGGIPLADVTLEMDGTPLLRLLDLTATSGDVTATFSDADGDGRVSAGDTLRIEGPAGELALRDATTGLRVVPGAGLLLALAAIALAARVALRRR